MNIKKEKYILINKNELSEGVLDLLRDIFGESFDDAGGFIEKIDELAFQNKADMIIFE